MLITLITSLLSNWLYPWLPAPDEHCVGGAGEGGEEGEDDVDQAEGQDDGATPEPVGEEPAQEVEQNHLERWFK